MRLIDHRPMHIIHTAQALRTALASEQSVAFVPTMGNLHAGHIQLVKTAQQYASCVVVSIFVNPLQFGANEDLANYPRTLKADCEKLQAAGATLVFAPAVEEMYPHINPATGDLGQTMIITAPPIANALCGAARPGHFDGVATVVMKLFNLVQPQVAVFGKKDFQQLHIIREMVQQFNLPIDIVAGETVREPSGLAMSSRNGYLSDAEKLEATQLYQSLRQIAENISQGNNDYQSLCEKSANALQTRGWKVDYISVRSSLTLLPATPEDHALVILGAARLGSTRLIDNIELKIEGRI